MKAIRDTYRGKLTPASRPFGGALVLFLLTGLLCAHQARSRVALEKTRDELLRATGAVTQLQSASKARREALASYKSHFLAGDTVSSLETVLYSRVDALKAQLHPEELTVSPIAKKGDELSLQYSFKLINPRFDDFLNALSSLDGTAFPLTVVDAVSVTGTTSKGKEGLCCTVSGRVIAFKEKKS